MCCTYEPQERQSDKWFGPWPGKFLFWLLPGAYSLVFFLLFSSPMVFFSFSFNRACTLSSMGTLLRVHCATPYIVPYAEDKRRADLYRMQIFTLVLGVLDRAIDQKDRELQRRFIINVAVSVLFI